MDFLKAFVNSMSEEEKAAACNNGLTRRKHNNKVYEMFKDDKDYGLVPEKPLMVESKKYSDLYVNSLTDLSGKELKANRIGSIKTENIGGITDVYDLKYLDGTVYQRIYANMYSTVRVKKAPYGLNIKVPKLLDTLPIDASDTMFADIVAGPIPVICTAEQADSNIFPAFTKILENKSVIGTDVNTNTPSKDTTTTINNVTNDSNIKTNYTLSDTALAANNSSNESVTEGSHSTRICKFCGKKIPSDSLFCTHCGNKLEFEQIPIETPTMFCRKCGKKIPADSIFCPKCGKSLQIHNSNEMLSKEFSTKNTNSLTNINEHSLNKSSFINKITLSLIICGFIIIILVYMLT